ncbi:TraR/DksA family transcriptional regulator [Pikeienuella piscinae]|uniref:TraR/DksA family transcriptional regulator n=1 Tax=Pikeienuella piscinae TaxID=2748098 RepID=A0A7L5BSM1_9RHOB|nr:TraR/DksA family transcriptional regulator [Pikeienuella piscinae]
MVKIADMRARLMSQLGELEELDRAGLDERAIVVLDQQSVGRVSRADLLQRQKMAQETHRRRRQERMRIVAALKRIESEEYGWCANCGAEIAPGRLAADPTAHLCIECAR